MKEVWLKRDTRREKLRLGFAAALEAGLTLRLDPLTLRGFCSLALFGKDLLPIYGAQIGVNFAAP